jgi:hypothetical protein
MHTPILKQSPFLFELSWTDGDGPDFFIISSSFRIYPNLFIFIQQKTRNCIESCQTVKCAERISPRLELHFDVYPLLKQLPFLNKLSWKTGDGPNFFVFPSSFRFYPIWFIFMQQKTRNCVGSCPTVKCAERISPRLELHFDAYPHLESVAFSQQIEPEGWGWARSLRLS